MTASRSSIVCPATTDHCLEMSCDCCNKTAYDIEPEHLRGSLARS